MKVYSLIGSRGVGSVGELTIQKWKDKTVARTKPVSVENPQTEAQMSHRQKFQLLVALSRVLSSVITVGFKQISTSMTTFNSFIKYNIQTAISGSYPNFTVNQEYLTISRGSALPLSTVVVSAGAGGNAQVVWTQPAGSPVPADSTLYLAIIDWDNQKLAYFAGAEMSSGTLLFPDSASIIQTSGHPIYTFYVNSANGATSDSVWQDSLM